MPGEGSDEKKVVEREVSQLEETMLFQIRALEMPEPVREFLFMPHLRRFKFDFAWPQIKLALEVEGGTFIDGRHSRGVTYARDCEKYSEAAIRGWCVIRATTDMIKNGKAFALLERAWQARQTNTAL